MALLFIKEQIGSLQAIHLHVLQLPKDWVTLQYMHYHSRIPRECRRMGPTRAVSHHHLQHHGVFLHWGLIDPLPNICQCIRQPLHRKLGGCHLAMCTPLGHLGNTSLLSPLRVHHRCTTAITSNL